MPTLTNWNHEITFSVTDDKYKTPSSIDEVQAIVKDAHDRGEKVTVVGAIHSTTRCMEGKGIVISMQNMANVLSIDWQKRVVTVQAGVTLHQLCRSLKPVGLQPGVILEFGNFQIGAISGTHANDTSLTREAQFSSYAIGFKLVTPSGEIREVSETQDPDLLPYLRSHFGLFGVVCEVTLRVFKSQPLQITTKPYEIEQFLTRFSEELQNLKATQDQVFGMLFPHTGKLLLQCRKFVQRQQPTILAGLKNLVMSKGINLYKDVLLPLVKAGMLLDSPALADLISQAVVEFPLGVFSHDAYEIDPCDRGIIYEKSDPHFDFYDWVFPEDRWCDMVQAFLGLADQFRRDRQFVLPLPALIYFIKQDRASMLSRSRHSDMIAVDPTYPDPNDGDWKAFRLAFNDVAMQHGGIPHINKTSGGAITHYRNACDRGALVEFLQKRKELDPTNLFLNPFFEEMFGEHL